MAQWVLLHPIFEVCTQQETNYNCGGRRRHPWWRQMAADSQFRVMLEDILKKQGSGVNGNLEGVSGGGGVDGIG